MGLLARILGISKTKRPADPGCWNYSNAKVEVELKRAPELSAFGGAIRLEGKGLPERVLLLRGVDGAFYALKNRCTHFGRRLDPVDGTMALCCCSVSKSTFFYSGNPLFGPGKEPVKSFQVRQDGGKLIVSLP